MACGIQLMNLVHWLMNREFAFISKSAKKWKTCYTHTAHSVTHGMSPATPIALSLRYFKGRSSILVFNAVTVLVVGILSFEPFCLLISNLLEIFVESILLQLFTRLLIARA